MFCICCERVGFICETRFLKYVDLFTYLLALQFSYWYENYILIDHTSWDWVWILCHWNRFQIHTKTNKHTSRENLWGWKSSEIIQSWIPLHFVCWSEQFSKEIWYRNMTTVCNIFVWLRKIINCFNLHVKFAWWCVLNVPVDSMYVIGTCKFYPFRIVKYNTPVTYTLKLVRAAKASLRCYFRWINSCWILYLAKYALLIPTVPTARLPQ